MTLPKHYAMGGCLAAVLACGACGRSGLRPVHVAGRVLIDGKPLADASVQVMPEGFRPAFGQTDEQGCFTLMTFQPGDGCVPGTHRVAVVAITNPTPYTDLYMAPERYADPATSGLEVTIDKPIDDLEILLTWGGQ